eukprot:scaffold53143_cov23-Tisochrysis_lutea.AAC.3
MAAAFAASSSRHEWSARRDAIRERAHRQRPRARRARGVSWHGWRRAHLPRGRGGGPRAKPGPSAAAVGGSIDGANRSGRAVTGASAARLLDVRSGLGAVDWRAQGQRNKAATLRRRAIAFHLTAESP